MGKYLLHYDNMTQFMAEQDDQNQYVKSIVPGVAYVESGETVHYNEIPKWKTVSIKYGVIDTALTYSLCNGYQDTSSPEYNYGVYKDNWTQYLKGIKINGNYIDPTIAVATDYGTTQRDPEVLFYFEYYLAYHFSASGIYDIDYVFIDEIPTNCFSGYRDGVDRYYNPDTIETSIIVSEGFTYIPQYGFSNEKNLKSITLPSTLQEIADECFARDSNLTEITCLAKTAPSITTYTFGNLPNGTLYYPAGSDYSTWLEALGEGWTGVEI